MKESILISILTLLLFSAAVRAEEPDDLILYPYSRDVIYRQEAAPYIEYFEKKWKFYKIGVESLRKIEKSATAEFRSEKINCSIQLELDDLKPGIKTKIQFFKKPVFFVFTVTN